MTALDMRPADADDPLADYYPEGPGFGAAANPGDAPAGEEPEIGRAHV